jgi:omega-hydroxy-beta-dihydromenaquinone-9 sulfotransferase
LRRLFILPALIIFYCCLEFITWICLGLDELIFPKYRKIQVQSPLFIIGMPRTASTWLHQTLFSDTDHFTSMKSWEIVFAPSILQKKAVNLFSKADKRCGHIFSAPLKKLDSRIFRGHSPAHPTSFFGLEEDDIVLTHIFASSSLAFIFPRMKRLKDLTWFDERLSERKKKKILRFFRKCIQKHLYVYGNGRTYISKSPFHTPKIRSLKAEFPGSRFICTFRKPEQVIPSALSLLRMFFTVYGNHVDPRQMKTNMLDLADHWYSFPLENFRDWNPGEYFLADYSRLTGNPETAIAGIYDHFGYQASDEFRQKLVAAGRQNSTFSSPHRYSASEFGLSEEEIRQRYQPLYEQYLTRSAYGA